MKSLAACLGAVICSLVVAAPTLAQNQSVPPSGSGILVAVIDVPKVFEYHARFKAQMDAIQTDVKAYEDYVNAERKKLAARGEQLQQLKSESPEYKRLEKDLATAASQLNIDAQLKRKEVLELEAKHYYEAYQEVLANVSQVADAHGISLVLRFDSKEIDPSDLNSVARGVNRPVVFQRNLDITQLVIDRLNAVTRR